MTVSLDILSVLIVENNFSIITDRPFFLLVVASNGHGDLLLILLALYSFELIYREILVNDFEEGLNDSETEGRKVMRRALCLLTEFNAVEESPHPPVVESGRAGRPMLSFPISHLVYLVENHFTVPQII